jgi:ABC-type multidrug transport system fused ATPase/permease subunit
MNFKEHLFQNIVGATALFVASIAALFSILGIGMLFSGAYISTVIMGISLETGKVVATSFLYRFWQKTSKWLKIYLCAAVLTLMVITSMGVFGWLSSAYQASAIEYEISQQKTAALIEQRAMTQSQANFGKQRVDMMLGIRSDQEKRMNEALNNPILSRNPTALRQVQEQNIDLIKRTDSDLTEEKKKYSEIVTELSNVDKQILESKSQTGKTKDIVTFKFVAEALGLDMNTTVKWFIMVIIVVFDPLAISLILAYNIMAYGNKKDINIVPSNAPIETPPPKEPTVYNKPQLLTKQPVTTPIVTPIVDKNIPIKPSISFVTDPSPVPISIPNTNRENIKIEAAKHLPNI